MAATTQKIPVTRGSKSARFAALRLGNPEMPARQAADEAGFSPNTELAHIEKYLPVDYHKLTIQEQREALSRAAATSYTNTALMVHREIADTTNDPNVRVSAARLFVGMQGYEAPKQMDIRQTGLFLELSGLSADDLQAFGNMADAGEIGNSRNISGKIEDAACVSDDVSMLCG